MTKREDRKSIRHGEERPSGRVSNHAICISLGLAALLAACDAAPKPAPTPEQAALLRPADPRLSELYETSCKACHTIADSGAPMIHDAAAWAPRWKQGLPVLIDHSIQGFNAMPAGGQCATCTPADLEALIRFMADHEDSAG
ncbi:MAG: c-type cytochrome [Caulobacter sp.]